MKIIKFLNSQIKNYFFRYALGLIFCKEKRSSIGLAKLFNISHDSIYRLFSKSDILCFISTRLMIKIANYYSKQKKGWIIVDDTSISKIHAKWIEGLIDVFDTALKRTNRGICLVVVAWSNGKTTIPIGFKFWITKNLINKYEKKSELAIKLISDCSAKGLQFRYVVLDGLYCNKTVINFLQTSKIGFEMRIHSNRKVWIKGTSEQLKKHFKLRLNRNARSKTAFGIWHNHFLYFTAHKRRNKNGDVDIVFQVSNMNIPAYKHIEIYEQRWEIEKMFRSMKQILGIGHCSARKIEHQTTHFHLVFFSYAFLQKQKTKLNFPNVETAARYLQQLKLKKAMSAITAFGENF